MDTVGGRGVLLNPLSLEGKGELLATPTAGAWVVTPDWLIPFSETHPAPCHL